MGTRDGASARSTNETCDWLQYGISLDRRRSRQDLREIEALVASKASGDTPDAPASELPRPRVLRFEVAADTFATFREAVQQLQRLAGARLDDDALLLALARHVPGGPRDEGRSSYQISLHVCSACGSGAQPAAGELVPVEPAVVDMAACDAQHLGELVPLAAVSRAANGARARRRQARTPGRASTASRMLARAGARVTRRAAPLASANEPVPRKIASDLGR